MSLNRIIKMAFFLATKNGPTEKQFFQALLSRDLESPNENQKLRPASMSLVLTPSPVSGLMSCSPPCWLGLCFNQMMNHLFWEESPIPCYPSPSAIRTPPPTVWLGTSLWSSFHIEPCIKHLFHCMCAWLPDQTECLVFREWMPDSSMRSS